MIKKLDHLVITTAQLSACLDFYQRLGFTLCQGQGRYELYGGDFKINVHVKGHELEPKAAFVQTGSADLCFEIEEDMEAFVGRLRVLGLQTETEIVHRKGARGAMESVYLRDPDGNLIEFCSYLPSA